MATIEATATSYCTNPYYCRPRQQFPTLTSSSTSQEVRIRSRLLHRLGIHQKQSLVTKTTRTQTSVEYKYHPIHVSTVSVPFLQPLRDKSTNSSCPVTTTFSSTNTTMINNHGGATDMDHRHHDIVAQRPRSSRERNATTTTTTTATRRRIIVRFDNNVLVVPIPSRHAYSNRIKKAFWRDGSELRDIADRNRYEFASEGYDWNQVLEDEDMYVDAATGELVHPCWVEYEDDDYKDEDYDPVIQADNDEEKYSQEEEQVLFESDGPTLKRGDSILPL